MATSTQFHDAVAWSTQLRQTINADKLRVGFVLGAGCGQAVGLTPGIAELTHQVGDDVGAARETAKSWAAVQAILREDGAERPNIETILNCVRSLRSVAGKAAVRGLTFDELNALDGHLCASVRKAVNKDLSLTDSPYHSVARYASSHRRPVPEIFTTNYDLLVEQALEAIGVPYFDGFVGVRRPFFDIAAIETEDMPPRWARVWKLHGSTNWKLRKDSRTVYRCDQDDEGSELLIHPSHMKYDESRRMPYFVMIDRLRSFLHNRGEPVALIVVGYSFGDDHINEVIVDGLRANANAACFALLFGNLSDYKFAATLAQRAANLTVLAKDQGVVRRQAARWGLVESADPALARNVYSIEAPPADSDATKNEGDKSSAITDRTVNFLLGDFNELGRFLDEYWQFSPSARP